MDIPQLLVTSNWQDSDMQLWTSCMLSWLDFPHLSQIILWVETYSLCTSLWHEYMLYTLKSNNSSLLGLESLILSLIEQTSFIFISLKCSSPSLSQKHISISVFNLLPRLPASINLLCWAGAFKGLLSQVHLFLLEWSMSCEKRKDPQTQGAVATADLMVAFLKAGKKAARWERETWG